MSAENQLNAKKQLNIRVDPDIIAKIEETERPKQAVVTDALKLYFDGCPQQDDSIDAAFYAQQIAEKDKQIAELHVMLQTSINVQHKLLPPPTREHWWQIWRKNP